MRSRETITEAQVSELWQLGMRLEQVFGKAQDIEWAIDAEGKIWLIQSRPITTIGREPVIAFDNSNIVESFPGICSPLTYSIARHGYETVFRKSALAQGMPDQMVTKYPEMHGALLGYVHGRIFYNLNNWYRRFDNIPGAHRRIHAMEQALGLQERTTVPEKPIDFPTWQSGYYRAHALIRRAWSFLFLDRRIKTYLQSFEAEWRQFEQIKLEEAPYTNLLEHDLAVISRLLCPYIISIANDGFAQVFYRTLQHLIGQAGFQDSVELMNGLLCGQKDIASVDIVRSLYALAEIASADIRLAALIEDAQDLGAAWNSISSDPVHRRFYKACCLHISLYKDRVIGELKIESKTLDEAPHVFLSMVKNVLRSGKTWVERENIEREVRSKAEAALRKRLHWRPLTRAIVQYVLYRTRTTVANRENLRMARTRGMGMLRRIYREIGRRFSRDRVIAHARDIEFLTREEIAALIHGCSPTSDISGLVEQRKREAELYKTTSIPSRFTVSPPVFKGAFDRLAGAGKPDSPSNLKGLGCSGGICTAKARVFKNPDASAMINGEILVAASTDPAWVFLMITASGLISEKGSALSHTAIVGRELGIPTIVGVPDATNLLHNDDVLTMDGSTGEVFVKKRAVGTNGA